MIAQPFLASSRRAIAALLLCGAAAGAQTPDQSAPVPAALLPDDPAQRLSSAMRVLAGDPRDLAALDGAGRAALEIGDFNGALGFFGRAEQVAPQDGRAKAGLASALVQLEQPRRALPLFAQAVQLGVPVNAIAADRGLAFDLVGDTANAQRDYAIALARSRDDETLRRYALSLGISGNRDKALDLLDPLVRRRDPAGWRARAFVLALTGDAPGADSIVAAMMPSQSRAMEPFMAELARLTPAQKAAAVNFGDMPAAGAGGALLAQRGAVPLPGAATGAALVPAGTPFGRTTPATTAVFAAPPSRPAPRPVQASVTPPVPAAPATRLAAAPAPRPSPPIQSFAQAASPLPAPAPVPLRIAAPIPAAPAAAVPAPVTPDVRLAAVAPVAATAGTPAPAAIGPGFSGVASDDSPAAFIGPPAPAQVAAPRAVAPEPAPVAAKPEQLALAEPAPARPTAAAAEWRARFGSSRPSEPLPEQDDARAPEPKPASAPKPVATGRHGKGQAAASDDKPGGSGHRKTASAERADSDADGDTRRPGGKDGKRDSTARTAGSDKSPGHAAKQAGDDTKTAKIGSGTRSRDRDEDAGKSTAARVYVQVAGGANKDDMPKAWAGVKKRAPDLLNGRTASTTPLRFTNRLLVGPFKDEDEAQGFVNKLAGRGMSGSIFKSAKGQKIEKVPTAK